MVGSGGSPEGAVPGRPERSRRAVPIRPEHPEHPERLLKTGAGSVEKKPAGCRFVFVPMRPETDRSVVGSGRIAGVLSMDACGSDKAGGSGASGAAVENPGRVCGKEAGGIPFRHIPGEAVGEKPAAVRSGAFPERMPAGASSGRVSGKGSGAVPGAGGS